MSLFTRPSGVQGIETTETISGNTELQATTGVLVVPTPDGTEEGAIVNVDYVNSVVGDVADILSEV